MSLRFRSLTGAAVAPVLDDLARLRIAVFRDWPYLYDGDLDYERRYLENYRRAPGAIVVAAFDGERLVGAATGMAMEDHATEFSAPLARAGLAAEAVFYCAESVLLPGYRGQGAGHRFFDLREAHARALGRRHAVFCAVTRPADHPARPAGYRPLDDFWRKRGYEPVEGAFARFAWRDEPRLPVRPRRADGGAGQADPYAVGAGGHPALPRRAAGQLRHGAGPDRRADLL
jgi:GNAT superfamily N-acetyltransferase